MMATIAFTAIVARSLPSDLDRLLEGIHQLVEIFVEERVVVLCLALLDRPVEDRRGELAIDRRVAGGVSELHCEAEILGEVRDGGSRVPGAAEDVLREAEFRRVAAGIAGVQRVDDG